MFDFFDHEGRTTDRRDGAPAVEFSVRARRMVSHREPSFKPTDRWQKSASQMEGVKQDLEPLFQRSIPISLYYQSR